MGRGLRNKTTRRLFVVTSAGVVATLPLAGCGLPTGQAEAAGQFGAGNVNDISVGQLKPVGQAPLLLGRDVAGLYSLSTICSHQACDIRDSGEITNQTLTCGCHNSVFDANGTVLSGPALSALTHYQVLIDGSGNITIDADIEVAPSARTPVQ